MNFEIDYGTIGKEHEPVTPLTDEQLREFAESQSGLVIYEANFNLWDTLPNDADKLKLIRALIKYRHDFVQEELTATDPSITPLLNMMYRAALPGVLADFKKGVVYHAKQRARGEKGGRKTASIRGVIKKSESANTKQMPGKEQTIGEIDIPTGEEFHRMFADPDKRLYMQVILEGVVPAMKRDSPNVPISKIREKIIAFQAISYDECSEEDEPYEREADFQSLKKELKELSDAYA